MVFVGLFFLPSLCIFSSPPPPPTPKTLPTKNSRYSPSCPYESFQTLKALSNIKTSKDWSNIKVYSDLCVQSARRAMAHLVHAFKVELKRVTGTGKCQQHLSHLWRCFHHCVSLDTSVVPFAVDKIQFFCQTTLQHTLKKKRFCRCEWISITTGLSIAAYHDSWNRLHPSRSETQHSQSSLKLSFFAVTSRGRLSPAAKRSSVKVYGKMTSQPVCDLCKPFPEEFIRFIEYINFQFPFWACLISQSDATFSYTATSRFSTPRQWWQSKCSTPGCRRWHCTNVATS